MTATNPKVALLWASLSTFVGGATTSWAELLLFASVSALLGFAIYGAYGLAFSAGGMRRLYDRFQCGTEAVFGTIFAGLGITMIARAVWQRGSAG